MELVRVYKSFGGKHVLKGIDLAIYPKRTTVLIGASGSGKSVIIKHIMGLLKTAPCASPKSVAGPSRVVPGKPKAVRRAALAPGRFPSTPPGGRRTTPAWAYPFWSSWPVSQRDWPCITFMPDGATSNNDL